jgi:hypothetical protein
VVPAASDTSHETMWGEAAAALRKPSNIRGIPPADCQLLPSAGDAKGS